MTFSLFNYLSRAKVNRYEIRLRNKKGASETGRILGINLPSKLFQRSKRTQRKKNTKGLHAMNILSLFPCTYA